MVETEVCCYPRSRSLGAHAACLTLASQSVGSQRWAALTPLLYDWLATVHRTWPSLACRWGPLSELGSADTFSSRQRLYYAEQTDGSAPNTLIACLVDVAKPRCCDAASVARAWERSAGPASAFRKGKTLYHPGEVNKIREVNGVPCEAVVTHSDCAEAFLWNVSTQADRAGDGRSEPSRPDCLLVGHTADARFALATAPGSACVASGGEDTAVCLWRLADLDSSLLGAEAGAARGSLNSGGLGALAAGGAPPQLRASSRFSGHSQTIEDVSFHPTRDTQLCSVGDDSALCFWDAGAGATPALKLAGAHGSADVHCCDWSAAQEHLVLTGGADNSVRLFDRRKGGQGGQGTQAALLHVFRGHSDAVNAVQWCPDAPTVFASAGSDGLVNVWDTQRLGQPPAGGPPPELIFQHPGHKGSPVLDFQWSAAVPWTCVSVSENAEAGGSLVQCWRMSDFIYRPEADILAEMERHREQLTAPPPAEDAEVEEDVDEE